MSLHTSPLIPPTHICCRADPENDTLAEALEKLMYCSNCRADITLRGGWTGVGHATMERLLKKHGKEAMETEIRNLFTRIKKRGIEARRNFNIMLISHGKKVASVRVCSREFEALAKNTGLYNYLYQTETVTDIAGNFIEPLLEAIKAIKADRGKFKQLTTPNQHGVFPMYIWFCQMIKDLLDACQTYPEARIEQEFDDLCCGGIQ